MRGYFAVGVDGISKPMNLGNLMRIAHAFDASFFFSINAQVKLAEAQSDTSQHARRAAGLRLPVGGRVPPADRLPAGRRGDHRRRGRTAALPPSAAARPMCSAPSACPCRQRCLSRCEFVVKIPTRFSINVGMAGAIVLYDRLISLGGYRQPADGAGTRAARHSAAASNGVRRSCDQESDKRLSLYSAVQLTVRTQ